MYMDNQKVSVIVPVYNVEPYIDKCVHSIVSQTYSNLEIILVDDGSPDNCHAVCDAWSQRDSRIKVVHKSNGGLSDARNAGLAVSTGDFIGFVDSDDWIAPEMFEKLLTALIEDNSDIAACTVEMVWEDGTPSRLLTDKKNCVLNKLEAQKALLEETILKQPVWYKLYRRNTIEGILFETGKCHEDVFWSYQAIGNAERISVIDYIGYYYLQRKGSIMGEGYSLKRLDALEAYDLRYKYIAERFPELETEARIGIVNACIYNGQMALKYLPKKERKDVFRLLRGIQQKYKLRHREYAHEKITHRIWLDTARISLTAVCRIKNAINVGC